jgi:hypothetical protein
MKTLADCSGTEFLGGAFRARRAFHALYKAAGIGDLFRNFCETAAGADEETRDRASHRYVEDLFWGLIGKAPEETMDVVAACALMTREEAEKLKPTEILKVLTDCISDSECMTFFISAESSAGSDTDGILRTLMLLSAGFLGGNTSENTSQEESNETGS